MSETRDVDVIVGSLRKGSYTRMTAKIVADVAPSGLKLAIDVGSRPYGESAWAEKPCAVISVSPGAVGGVGANHLTARGSS